ncbi:MAG: Hint domain-containing protein [Pseudomonadota bacterium]
MRGNREVPAPEDVEEGGAAFVITDGRRMFEFAVIRASATELLVAKGALPPRDTDLWVVRATPATSGARAEVSMVCFTTSTHIATPTGDRPVEDVRPGDLVTTRDNGPQPVLWNGHQHIGGARLYAMPHLRPIRIEAAAFGPGHPDSMLLLSPEHRVLLSGGAARGLFGVEEILVASKHLVDDRRVSTDRASRWVTYHHLMLERHEVLVANGLPCESFHPADADMGGIADDQRNALFEVAPELGAGTTDYGPHARRVLTRAEAALLAYGGH